MVFEINAERTDNPFSLLKPLSSALLSHFIIWKFYHRLLNALKFLVGHPTILLRFISRVNMNSVHFRKTNVGNNHFESEILFF